jgi:hypothetical protein
MNKRLSSKVSRIRPSGLNFSLSEVPLGRFVQLGKQHKDPAIVHTVYLRKPSLGDTCFVNPRIKVSGYCSYSLIECESIGLLGVVFYTYCKKTKINPNSIVVERNVQLDKSQEEIFTPLFTLERLDLLIYPSDCGSVVVIPTVLLDVSLIVQAN